MKKILFAFGAAALSLAIVSCDKSGSTSDNPDKALGDSLSMLSGEYQGYQYLSSYNMIPEDEKGKFQKGSVLRGIEQVVLADTADQGYLAGINIGLQIYQSLARYEQGGVPVDRKKFMAEFAKAFKADSVDESQMMLLQTQFQDINRRAQEKAMAEMQRKADEARAAQEGEAKENKELGAKFVQAAKEKDPEIKTTESGLSYKVVKAGTGAAVGDNGRATVNYTGKLVDGSEFDSGEGVTFTPSQVVPGFGEGLKMMQKGGKYTLYIPAELAYGADGIPGSIPPMSTLVFEVEVTDVAQ